MSQIGQQVEESDSNATKPTIETSSLSAKNLNATTRALGDLQESPSLEFQSPIEQTSSYFSSSSNSSAVASPPARTAINKTVIDNPGVVTSGNEILEGRNISKKIPPIPPRKDSDDISYSKIKPAHNFFGQHPYHPYDSDGSDGSLVFSPGSTDDLKTGSAVPSDKKEGSSPAGVGAAVGKRNESAATPSSRARFESVDSVASNGSIRYVRPSPVNANASADTKQTAGQSQPINPQMLPYSERRKLIQQRQFEEQQQQYQQYHAAMMQAHSQASQQQQGHSSAPYQIDPRMAASYYQMYGMPPAGIYAPMPPHHNQQHSGSMPVNGYPYFAPQPGIPYYPMPNPVSGPHSPSHPQLQSSISQFSPQNPAAGYHQQPFPSPLMPSHQISPHFPSMPPQYAYLPQPPPPPPPPLSSDDAPEPTQKQEKRARQHQEPQKLLQPRLGSVPTSDRSRNGGKDSEIGTGVSVLVGGNSAPLPSAPTKTTNIKNNSPRLPPITARKPSSSISSSLSSAPPQQSHVRTPSEASSSYHLRAESYGSMSSLGSQGHGSVKKDGDEDHHQNQKQSNQNSETNQSTGTHNRKDSASFTVDTNITMNAPETPRHTDHERKNSFLDMLRMNWSPQSQNSSSSTRFKRPDVDEFHRKNQDFLNRTTALPPKTKASAAATNFAMSHRRVGSQDRPPASRGTHRRLQSISNDEWDDGDDDQSSGDTDNTNDKKEPTSTGNVKRKQAPFSKTFQGSESDQMSDSGTYTDDDRFTTDEDVRVHDDYDNANEFSSLLPPSGISSNEKEGKNQKYDRKSRRGRQEYEATPSARNKELEKIGLNDLNKIPSNRSSDTSSSNVTRTSDVTLRWDNRETTRKTRKKKYRHRNSKYSLKGDTECSPENSNSSDSDFDHRKWAKKRSRMLEKERSKLIEQWKAEAREEAELLRKEEEANRWYRRLGRYISEQMQRFGVKTYRFLTLVEKFIGNLPLTIGAVALAIVTLGVVWFKFMEEYLDTCEPVHFHSSQCTFPEFPGCFYCDTSALAYRIAIGFHYTCNVISGLLATLLVAKIILATRVVIDEMSSPTTSSPAGLLCMTSVCVFAGRGVVGQVIVSTAACIHLILAIWFIYMALAYNIMPEPSWFPNTVGIGLSAVKTWLYYPMPGHLLMAISLSLNFFFFPISLIRVIANKKISATVAWMQTSAPSVSLYALTIMAQPSFEEEQPDVTNFQHVHRMVYLPCMHVMCVLSLLGMAASIHSLYDRWADFKQKEFSPAHAAFCFPTLSHANSIQAYRAAVISFSKIRPRSWRMLLLDIYWFIVLVGGTIATVWICGKFLYKLPEWTSPDISNEEEPPAPYETLLSQQQMVTAGDTLTQNFVSPAILQANETGALILSRSPRDGTLRYVRTRRVGALGFEPTMKWSEIQEEEEKLLEWVGKHPPRRRNRTLSVPGIDFNYGSSQPTFGTGNSGVYGTFSPSMSRRRSVSQDGQSTFFK